MNILFVCKSNVGRSQMAEAFFSRLSKHKSISAGTNVFEKEGQPLHEFVVKCMAEEGYDLSKNKRKQITVEMTNKSDKIIVMAKLEELPSYLDLKKVILWNVDDAKDMSYEFHCKIRGQIKNLVTELVTEIG